MCLERSRKQFSLVWWSSGARIGLFMFRERSRKQFSPLCRSAEAGRGLFMCLERSRKQFSLVWWYCRARIGQLYPEKDRESSFELSGGLVKLA